MKAEGDISGLIFADMHQKCVYFIYGVLNSNNYTKEAKLPEKTFFSFCLMMSGSEFIRSTPLSSKDESDVRKA